MKYWRGYLTAAIFAAISWALMEFAKSYSKLVDMVYPYVTRSVQGFLTVWTSGQNFCVWQIALLVCVVVALATLVLVFVRKGSLITWLGWVLATVSILFCLHTGVYGLNYYASPIEDDLRLEMTDYTQSELEAALTFYRDKANELVAQLPRDEQGLVQFAAFEELAQQAGNGFRNLVMNRSFSVFGGDYTPVKRLGFANLYSAAGVSGVTVFLTGEAAVNPQIPAVSQPFVICREMAHRLCVARENSASFAAFLACEASDSMEYRYSGYLMAYRYCYNALYHVDAAAATRIQDGSAAELLRDLESHDAFFASKYEEEATRLSETVSDVYEKVSGEEAGPVSEGAVCDYLVNWYLIEYTTEEEVEYLFDPYDENQVDLSGIGNAKPRGTEPAA